MARTRNRPHGLLALILLAVVALLAVLAARVDAEPVPPDDTADPPDAMPLEPDPMLAPIAIPEPTSRLVPPIPVAVVIDAAYRAAAIDSDPTSSFRKRTRLAGLVPQISVRDGREATWRDVDDPTLTYMNVFDVTATWHPERLVFDPNEIRIAALQVSRRRERRRLAGLVIHVYYEWLALRAAPSIWSSRADEVTAELDALTDGWFSQRLAKTAEPR